MPVVSLRDGSSRRVNQGSTIFQLAEDIGIKLARNAVAARVDGALVDLSTKLLLDCAVEIITNDTSDGLEILRHDTAHVLAQAIKELYPDAKLGIGPVIKDGFYYDVYCKKTISSDDLQAIEEKMQEIVTQDYQIKRAELTKEEAIKVFSSLKEDYKLELIERFSANEIISVYTQGEFTDLCKGPHSPSTGRLKYFKLLKVSGAYWLGDHKNDQMQRIYGTAFANKKDLRQHLRFIEEAKLRDHRKIGKEMDLFHIQEESQGQVFWHSKGLIIFRELESYIRDKLINNGYQEIRTPLIYDRALWEKSGHWQKFKDDMFSINTDDRELGIKPMNCPAHIQIFNQQVQSYKNLPLRFAEFGMCHRNEPSGSLHGLMRVRGFTQDDGHIFCTEEHIKDETRNFCNLLLEIYKELGFEKIKVKFSDRPEKRIGDDLTWDKAESALKDAVNSASISYSMNPGDGAFYGPKIEFVLTDCIGREWQCGTLQVDFMLPQRLQAHYIDHEGRKKHPVMLHRAILGTFERFIAIMLEHNSGKLPIWLAPLHVVVTPVSDESIFYAQSVCNALATGNIRFKFDCSNKKVDYKIRSYSLQKVPFIWVVGKKECNESTVSVRTLGSSGVIVQLLDEAVADLKMKIYHKSDFEHRK